MTPLRTYRLLLGGAFLWCSLITAAPLLSAAGWTSGADFLYAFFHRICHQLEGRSLHIAGAPLAVCTRCASIYAAFLTGTMLYPLFRRLPEARTPSRRWLVIAILPMVIDVFCNVTGIHHAGTATRLITGAIAGSILPFFIVPLLTGAVSELRSSHTLTTIPSTSQGLPDA